MKVDIRKLDKLAEIFFIRGMVYAQVIYNKDVDEARAEEHWHGMRSKQYFIDKVRELGLMPEQFVDFERDQHQPDTDLTEDEE